MQSVCVSFKLIVEDIPFFFCCFFLLYFDTKFWSKTKSQNNKVIEKEYQDKRPMVWPQRLILNYRDINIMMTFWGKQNTKYIFYMNMNINIIIVHQEKALLYRRRSLPSQGWKSRDTLVCSAGTSLLWRYEAKQWAGPATLALIPGLSMYRYLRCWHFALKALFLFPGISAAHW